MAIHQTHHERTDAHATLRRECSLLSFLKSRSVAFVAASAAKFKLRDADWFVVRHAIRAFNFVANAPREKLGKNTLGPRSFRSYAGNVSAIKHKNQRHAF